jgi:hypothetical protein
MKRKAKRYDEGGKVYDKEDEGFGGSKIKYREDEEGRKYTAGRANPMDRNPQEQRYYSADDIKGKLSGLFGGSRDESKFSDLKSVGGDGRRPRTIEEQIGRKAEPKADAGETSGKLPGNKTDRMSVVSEEDAPYKVEKVEPKSSGRGKGFIPLKDKEYPKDAKPKAPVSKSDEDAEGERGKRMEKEAAKQLAKNKAAGNKQTKVGEGAKPLPGVSKDKSKPQNLPGKPERKKEPTPYKDVVKSEDVGSQSFASKSEKKESEAKTRAGTTARTPEVKTGTARTRAGTVVKSSDEPSAEAKTKAMSSLAAKIKKQDEENRFNFSPSKSPNRSYKSGGSVSSASSRGDGIAQRGKTRGRMR